jgi:tetratricopeptide (TPR) repeat protein
MRLAAWLREAPATLPALVALALFVVWATDQAGYPVTHWAPGGLIVLVLLGVAMWAVGLRRGEISTPVKVALGCLTWYTALSFLSILWAGSPGDAWEGANRTLLYLIVFALFACWRQRGRSAALLLAGWTLAMIGLAGFVVLHLNTATSSSLQSMAPEGRLAYPVGYVNANAAQWLMAFWPAALLARSERLPWALRGVLAGGAVLLAEVALLSQSRGSLYAMAAMLVLVFALLPGRVRTFALLAPLVAGIGAATPAVLRVGDRLQHGGDARAAIHSATAAMLAAAVTVALVVAIAAAIESRRAFSDAAATRVRRGLGAVAIATLVAILAGGWALAGDPVARVRHGWDTFKGGYAANSPTGNRLVSGLGSNRYDFYRVALDEFSSHPLVGIGADNFQQQYLERGRSDETPRYPHSIELRTLTETGLLGALLALVGLGAALWAGARALRRSVESGSDPLARAVATAALGGFAYWLVHGSVDWLWEFAGLGAPAFALLGLACALAPPGRRPIHDRSRALDLARRWGPRTRRLRPVLAGLVGLTAAVSLAAPWLSRLQVQAAARIWTKAPQRAYARLDDAAALNPLSDEAYLVAGSIALRFGELPRAEHDFSLALRRTPADAYATLEQGAIASSRNERGKALGLLERASRLNPRDSLTREALMLVRKGRRINVEELNRSILLKAQRLA